LVPGIGNIQELNFRYWDTLASRSQAPDLSSLTHLENLSLVSLDSLVFPRLPRSIKSLDVSGWYKCSVGISASQENLSRTSLDELVSLSMSGLLHLSTTDLFTLLAPNKGNLRLLDLSETEIDVKQLATAGYLSGVTELSLNTTRVDDETLEVLASSLPNLTTLAVSSTRVTGVGIRALTKKPERQMERLNLDFCNFVGADAVVYARSLGVVVSCKQVESSKGRPRNQ